MTKIDVTQSYFGRDFVQHKLVTNLALNPESVIKPQFDRLHEFFDGSQA